MGRLGWPGLAATALSSCHLSWCSTDKGPRSGFIHVNTSATGGCPKKAARRDDLSLSSIVALIRGISRTHRARFSPFKTRATAQGLTSPQMPSLHSDLGMIPQGFATQVSLRAGIRRCPVPEGCERTHFHWPVFFASWKSAWIDLLEVTVQCQYKKEKPLIPLLWVFAWEPEGSFCRCPINSHQSHTKPQKICWAAVGCLLIKFIFSGKLNAKVSF